MERFIGTKIILAKPMTRKEYNDFRGWTLPENEAEMGNNDGYVVEYTDGGKPNVAGHDGYVSWSPKEQFEKAYQRTDGLIFGLAIEALKKGHKVARSGWNGKGMFLYYVPANSYPAQTQAARDYWADKQDPLGKDEVRPVMVPYGAYIAMKTAQENVVPWLASQTDVLADDWQVVD